MPLAMPSLAPAAPVAREADSLADSNWRANRAALAETQPELAARLDGQRIDITWLFGRDGALTARDATGQWWAGCSVPAAAAHAMLRSFACSGTVACFLRPPTAAAVRVALDKLRRNQAIVAIAADLDAVRVMLHCEPFADDLRAHRLWFVAADDWEAQVTTLLRANDGLPTPSQFVRLTDGNEELAEALIAPAQRAFSEITQQRAAAIGAIQTKPAASSRGPCIVAPNHFRLWDDAGHALAILARQLGGSHLDPDDPACAAPLAMARAAAGCSAVIMPNVGRADLPNVVAMETPWISWLTAPRIPAFSAAGPRDVLLVADPAWQSLATTAGWPAQRVRVAAWPVMRPSSTTKTGPLLILADVPPLDPPKEIVEMSSHRLLWEAIADELVRDPFAVGRSALDYMHARMKRLTIDAKQLDQRRFIDQLIAPAYARGLAEILRRNNVPLRLAGAGWDAIESLGALAVGPISSREQFANALDEAAALVHVWPTDSAHPIDACGRPIVRPATTRDSFLHDARTAIAGRGIAPRSAGPALSAELLAELLGN
jgi:hypothetical protein